METKERTKLGGLFAALVLALMIGLVSCSEETSVTSTDMTDDIFEFEDEQDVSDALDESDVFSAMDAADVPSNGRVTNGNPPDSAFICADIIHDKENNTITIDYGDGCVGLDGILRSGQVIITYTDHYLIPGAVITKTFNDYFINQHQVEGLITLTNTSVNLAANPEFNVVLEGGKVTFENETVATRESDFVVTWINAANPLNDEYHKDGVASGARSGTRYSMTITSTIVRKNICKLVGVNIPVQGTKFIEREGLPSLTIDYGSGDCDKEVTITREDGTTRVVENFRRFKRRALRG
ncbi:MAG: hypothetical protein AAFN93_11940 [Bacteroidota bacterium]